MLNKVFNNRYLKKRASDMNYRSRKMTARGNTLRAKFGGQQRIPLTVTDDDLKYVVMRSGGRCEWCGELIEDSPEFDHLHPYRMEDNNSPENLVASCRSCNRRKAQKHPAKFAQEVYATTGKMTNVIRRVFMRFGIIPLMQSQFDFEAYEDVEDVGTKAA